VYTHSKKKQSWEYFRLHIKKSGGPNYLGLYTKFVLPKAYFIPRSPKRDFVGVESVREMTLASMQLSNLMQRQGKIHVGIVITN
jgi:hypothetical protein